jgi:predicted ATP-grasp superfamily ATP-dependent carboligase
VRVLILDPGAGRSALAGCRALGRAGWTVGIGSPEATISARSRWASAFHPLPRLEKSAEAYIEAVDAAVRAEGYEVVVPAGDAETLAISRGRDSIGCTVPYGPHDSVEAVFDKSRLAGLAAEAGLAVPRRLPAEEVVAADLPVVVKPRAHAARRVHETAVARTIPELSEAVGALVDAGIEPLVQELVAGPLTAVSVVCDRSGAVVAAVQQRASAVWPDPAGVSTRAVTTAADPGLLAGIERLAAGLGWFGLAQFQFLDGPDGVSRLIDCNGRLYGSLSLALAAHVNLADRWCALAVGLPISPARPVVGTRYQWLEGDLRRIVEGGHWLEAAGVLAYSVQASHSILALEDPRPGAEYARQLAHRAVRKVLR